MRRRDLLVLAIAGVVAGSVGSQAQPVTRPVIGWLSTESAGSFEAAMQAFRQGLSQSGYVEGRNLVIEARWAEGQNSRLPDFASELTRRPVALIALTPSSRAELNNSACSQRSARYPRSSYIATSLWLAVSPPTAPTAAICSDKSAFTVVGYSRAKSRL